MATPADLSCRACKNPYQFNRKNPDRRPWEFEPPFHTVCAACFESLSYFDNLVRKFNCPFCNIVHDVNQSGLNAPLLEIIGVAEQQGIIAENREPSPGIEDEPVDEEVRSIIAMSGVDDKEIPAPSPISRPVAPDPLASPEVEDTFNA